MLSNSRKKRQTQKKRSWKKAKRKETRTVVTRTVVIILDSTCGRIAHTTEITEETLTTRTLEEDSKEEAKEEDSKTEDSTQIRVAVLEEEAEAILSSTSKDMEEVTAVPLQPIKQDSWVGIVITAKDSKTNRFTIMHNMIILLRPAMVLTIKEGL